MVQEKDLELQAMRQELELAGKKMMAATSAVREVVKLREQMGASGSPLGSAVGGSLTPGGGSTSGRRSPGPTGRSTPGRGEAQRMPSAKQIIEEAKEAKAMPPRPSPARCVQGWVGHCAVL